MDSRTLSVLEGRHPRVAQCLPVTLSRNLQCFAWNPYVGVVCSTDVERVMGSYQRFCAAPEEARDTAELEEGATTHSGARNRRRRRKGKKISVDVPAHSPFRALEGYGKEPSVFQLQRVFEEQIKRLQLRSGSDSIP